MDTIKVKITGVGPMLMHAPTLSDPLNQITKNYKELNKKADKTDEDILAVAKMSWHSSLYFDNDLGPYIPSVNVEACIKDGAKEHKLGKKVAQAVMIQENKIKLEYKGPRTAEALWEDARFRDVRAVGIQRSKIMRYRPKFDEWAATFTVMFNSEQIDRSDLIRAITDAGQLKGIGDFRPRFGRFEVEVLK